MLHLSSPQGTCLIWIYWVLQAQSCIYSIAGYLVLSLFANCKWSSMESIQDWLCQSDPGGNSIPSVSGPIWLQAKQYRAQYVHIRSMKNARVLQRVVLGVHSARALALSTVPWGTVLEQASSEILVTNVPRYSCKNQTSYSGQIPARVIDFCLT